MRKTIDHVNQSGISGSDAVLEAIHAVMHAVRARQHQALRDSAQDITPMEARVLGFFARHAGATLVDLARHAGRDKGQLARLIAGLKDRGLLAAEPDADDRRLTRLQLTPRAQAQHAAVQQLRQGLAQVAVDGLSTADQQQLLRLLKRVQDNLAGQDAPDARDAQD